MLKKRIGELLKLIDGAVREAEGRDGCPVLTFENRTPKGCGEGTCRICWKWSRQLEKGLCSSHALSLYQWGDVNYYGGLR